MRWLYLILIVLLAVPFASASITLNDLKSDKYNLGDSITLSGTISYTENFRGYKTMIANCATPMILDTAIIDLPANKEYSFSKAYTLTKDFEGQCKFSVKIIDPKGANTEDASFRAITTERSLNAKFEPTQTKFQLGSILSIKGSVNKLNGEPVADGIALIYFKNNGTINSIESATIDAGTISYSKDLSLIPAGTYTLNIKVQDMSGNEKLIEDAVSFQLSDSIAITKTTSKTEYPPKATLEITGKVHGAVVEELKNLKIKLFVDNNEVQTKDISDSTDEFSFEYELAKDIKSGAHAFVLDVKDDKGNYGKESGTFIITAVPTNLTSSILSTEFLPEKELKFNLNLVDQAGDKIDGTAKAYMINPKENVIETKDINLNTENSFTIPKFAEPGTWTLKVESKGLKQLQTFAVKEVIKFNVWIEGQMLYVHNLGNIPFDSSFTVYANELNKSKSLELDVNEKKSLDLAELFPTGVYKIKTSLTDKEFSNINIVREETALTKIKDVVDSITGKVVYGAKDAIVNGPLGIILLVITAAAIFVFAFRIVHIKKRKKFSWEKEVQLGNNKKIEIIRSKVNQTPGYSSAKKLSKEMSNYRDELLRRSQEKSEPYKIEKGEGKYVNFKDDSSEDKGSMFNMFG